MDDFSAKPGVPNAYGLIGGEANAVAAAKRPLSSMTPTIVMKDGEPFLATGSPGGSRIITMVLLAAMAWMDGADAQSMVDLKRYHHQFAPDQVAHEEGAFTPEEAQSLISRGHDLNQARRAYGNMNVVTWDFKSGEVEAATDPRGDGEGRVY
jgi:gamma-glutamyltranspeptidase/glutathione hydrolase